MDEVTPIALPNPEFWRDKRVLLTGHSGFKGSWAALWLEQMGAEVTGFALPCETSPNLFGSLEPIARLRSIFGDINDSEALTAAVAIADPEVVLHMAAQPLVRRSYREPVQTFATNVLGTAALLDALRKCGRLAAVLVVTTDKVYRNTDDGRPFTEDDPLGGHDPYSSSKAAAELAAESWAASFFAPRGIPVATARAGNVVGGGDWSEDRLVPDLWRATQANASVVLRYPNATRPWQHVLDPLCGYLLYLEQLAAGKPLPLALNFGPAAGDVQTVREVAETVLGALGSKRGWEPQTEAQPHEMQQLALDANRAGVSLGWRPRLRSAEALRWTADWYQAYDAGRLPRELVQGQIAAYRAL